MPAYSYEAVDAEGKIRKGTLDADTVRTVRSMLRAQNLVPLKVLPLAGGAKKGSGLQREIWSSPILSGSALAVWTRQLASLVASRMPLERALAALAEDSEKEKMQNMVAHLRSEVNSGSTFAKALGEYPREFSEVYRAVVAAGEQSGAFDTVLLQLAEDLENQQTLKSKIMAASLYPGIVTCISILIVSFLMTYVVPQVAQVITSSKQKLPLLTSIMLAASAFLRNYGHYLVLILLVVLLGLRYLLKTDTFRLRWDNWWLTAPVFGRLIKSYHSARFASTLSLLVAAGVPILKALQTAAETLGNRALREDALDALILVREGAPLASALSSKKRFPGLISMFARLGEQTGQLPAMLGRAAQQLSNEVQRRSTALATILEPLLILAMGVVVMVIVLAVLLPIINLNQLAR